MSTTHENSPENTAKNICPQCEALGLPPPCMGHKGGRRPSSQEDTDAEESVTETASVGSTGQMLTRLASEDTPSYLGDNIILAALEQEQASKESLVEEELQTEDTENCQQVEQLSSSAPTPFTMQPSPLGVAKE